MKKTFIYTLSDPTTGKIRYVGKSNFPKKRYYNHISSCHRTHTHKNNWIKSLLKENKRPILNVVDEVPVDDWQTFEKYWIDKLLEEGNELTNIAEGGNGVTQHTYNTIEKMKIRHKLYPNYNRSGNNLKQTLDRDLLNKLYITENLSMPEIAEKLNISETTIFRNLKDYDINKDKSIWKSQCASNPTKVVLQYDLSGNLIKEWPSAVSVYKNLKIKPAKCCRGEAKSSGGFIWRYKDEWFDLGLDKLDEHSKKVTQYD